MAAHQAPPSLGFSRQEHWSGLPFPSPMHEHEKRKWSCSVVSDSLWPHGLQSTGLLCPWDFPGKSTGVGHQCLLHLDWLPVFVKAWDELQKVSDAIWMESIFRYCKPQAALGSCGRGMCEYFILASLRNQESIYFYTWSSAQHTLKTGCWIFRHLRQVFIAISWG